MRYLVVETSWIMVGLSRAFSDCGLLLSRTDRPEDVADILKTGEIDAVLLEAEGLGHHGISLKSLRARHPFVSIAVVAEHPIPADVTQYLQAGADTVLDQATPRDAIVAQMIAITRRAHGYATSCLRFGPLSLNIDRRHAEINGAILHLTPKVYELLEYLVLRAGQLVTRDALLSHVYGFETEPDARVFDVYMCTLRRFLKETRGAVEIQTVRGKGFRFVSFADTAEAA